MQSITRMIHTMGGSVFNKKWLLYLIIAIKIFLLAGRVLLCSIEALLLWFHRDYNISYSLGYGYFQVSRLLNLEK